MAGQWKKVELTGSVVAVDVQERTFRMRIDDIGNVSARFTEEQGANVMAALTDHDHVRVRVCGRGRVYGARNPEANLRCCQSPRCPQESDR